MMVMDRLWVGETLSDGAGGIITAVIGHVG